MSGAPDLPRALSDLRTRTQGHTAGDSDHDRGDVAAQFAAVIARDVTSARSTKLERDATAAAIQRQASPDEVTTIPAVLALSIAIEIHSAGRITALNARRGRVPGTAQLHG